MMEGKMKVCMIPYSDIGDSHAYRRLLAVSPDVDGIRALAKEFRTDVLNRLIGAIACDIDRDIERLRNPYRRQVLMNVLRQFVDDPQPTIGTTSRRARKLERQLAAVDAEYDRIARSNPVPDHAPSSYVIRQRRLRPVAAARLRLQARIAKANDDD